MIIMVDFEDDLTKRTKAQIMDEVVDIVEASLDAQLAEVKKREEKRKLAIYIAAATRVANDSYSLEDLQVLKERLDNRKPNKQVSK